MEVDRRRRKGRGSKGHEAKPQGDDGWVHTDELVLDTRADEMAIQPVADPGKPWRRDSTLLLGQLAVSLVLLIVGDVLFIGYTLGIFSGLICWAVALLGIFECMNSRPVLQCKNWRKYYMGLQILAFAIAAAGIFTITVLQYVYLEADQSDGHCTIRWEEGTVSTAAENIEGTTLEVKCGRPDSGSEKAYGDQVGCSTCLCVSRHSRSDDTCQSDCISSVIEDNVCGHSWRRHVAAEGGAIGFVIIVAASLCVFVRLCNFGVSVMVGDAHENAELGRSSQHEMAEEEDFRTSQEEQCQDREAEDQGEGSDFPADPPWFQELEADEAEEEPEANPVFLPK